ncbi:hypothetical protein ColTof4_13313 [Colletotrichum tofieldiae]|nr:hypothetical protein ColTof3_00610 [Colletotrichum tofieldiae]GKT80890.1 hypothetical protein ColTof4_13313 [Colletotrichum tofieldiae]
MGTRVASPDESYEPINAKRLTEGAGRELKTPIRGETHAPYPPTRLRLNDILSGYLQNVSSALTRSGEAEGTHCHIYVAAPSEK